MSKYPLVTYVLVYRMSTTASSHEIARSMQEMEMIDASKSGTDTVSPGRKAGRQPPPLADC